MPRIPSTPRTHRHRFEVLYNQLGVARLVEYVKLGLLDHRRVITMKVGGCVVSVSGEGAEALCVRVWVPLGARLVASSLYVVAQAKRAHSPTRGRLGYER